MNRETETTRTPRPTVRIVPENWLDPIPLDVHFGNSRPIEVDVGCGKGRFLLARASAQPDTNFLGIDRMLRRIRKVDNKARRKGLGNVRLLRVEAYYGVTYLMPANAVGVYYIFFPDPWPKKRHHGHRLFNERFLEALHRTLRPGGLVHVATDHLPYFESIREILRGDARFAETDAFLPSPEQKTDFELWYSARTEIGRCSFVKRESA
jgi:tRNA (guanine-N7-)-methyltransferase